MASSVASTEDIDPPSIFNRPAAEFAKPDLTLTALDRFLLSTLYRPDFKPGAAIDTVMAVLRPGEATRAHRHTSSAVFHVVRGHGRTKVGDTTLEWGPRDCFVAPNWAWHEHANLSSSEDAVLFSVNDTPLVRYLGLYREEPELSIARLDRAPRMFGSFLRAAWS